MKGRKLYLAIVISSLVPMLLTFCKKGDVQVNVEDLIVPTFSNDKKINIGAWSWTVKNFNNTQLSNLKDAGFNLLIGTFNDHNDNADSALLSRANEYDIDLIIDKRPWEGTIPSYADKENFLGYCVFDEPNKLLSSPERVNLPSLDRSLFSYRPADMILPLASKPNFSEAVSSPANLKLTSSNLYEVYVWPP